MRNKEQILQEYYIVLFTLRRITVTIFCLVHRDCMWVQSNEGRWSPIWIHGRWSLESSIRRCVWFRKERYAFAMRGRHSTSSRPSLKVPYRWQLRRKLSAKTVHSQGLCCALRHSVSPNTNVRSHWVSLTRGIRLILSSGRCTGLEPLKTEIFNFCSPELIGGAFRHYLRSA